MEVMLNHARDATNAAMNAKQNIEHAQVDPPPPKKNHQMLATRFQWQLKPTQVG